MKITEMLYKSKIFIYIKRGKVSVYYHNDNSWLMAIWRLATCGHGLQRSSVHLNDLKWRCISLCNCLKFYRHLLVTSVRDILTT